MKLELLSTEPTYLNMDHYYTNRKQYVMEKVDEIRVQVQISGVLLYLVVVAIDLHRCCLSWLFKCNSF